MGREIIQPSFNGGELSPALHGRVDLTKYASGLKICKNFVVQGYGGITNRPGLDYIAPVKDHDVQTRLIPFQFSTTQVYALEFGDLYMRVIKDGGHVLEPTVAITGANQANPVVVDAVAHGYVNGDEVYISGVSGMTEINGKRFIVANKDTDDFELQGIDGTGYTAYVSGGTVARIFTLVTPYVEADLPTLNYTQSADVMTICHPNYPPRDLSRTGHHIWSLDVITFEPDMDPPTSVVVTPAVGGAATYKYKVTAVADETLEESISALGETAAAHATHNKTNYIDVSWTAPVAGTVDKYNVYREENGIYGFIGSVDGTVVTYKDEGDDASAADREDTPPKARNPFVGAGNYPGAVSYYEQRKAFASTDNNPQKMWFSQAGAYKNLNVSSPIKDDDAITFTINARQVNRIRHLVPLSEMIMLTSGGEWKLGSGGDAFTPSTMRVRAQGEIGSSEVPPLLIGNTILFLQNHGSEVRDLAYTFESDSFAGSDLSTLSKHLFEGYEIKEWAYAQIPFSVIWCVRDDGKLLGLTYIKEQQVWGWHWHETDGEVESICSISEGSEDSVYIIVKRTVNGSDVRYIEKMHSRVFTDVEDAFFVDSGLSLNNPIDITDATQTLPVVITAPAHGLSDDDDVRITHVKGMVELNGGTFHIHGVTADTFELYADTKTEYLADGSYFADGAITAIGEIDNGVDGTGYSEYISDGEVRALSDSISGLDHLEGETVAILGDGDVQPNKIVTDGIVTLETAASEVHIGLPYESEMRTLSPVLSDNQGSAQSKKKHLNRVAFMFEKSRGGKIGAAGAEMTEIKQRGRESYGSPTEMVTGIQQVVIDPLSSTPGEVIFKQTDPLPVTILSIMPEVTIGG